MPKKNPQPKGILSNGQPQFTEKELRERIRGGKMQEIFAVVTDIPPVDMMNTKGRSEESVAMHTDLYYAHDCPFDPKSGYRTSMIAHYGEDFRQNARGIYYYDRIDPENTPNDRNLFIPSLEGLDWESKKWDGESRRLHAMIVAAHMRNNEDWNKSEFAWEMDAWSDLFVRMKDDPRLEVDKHGYNTNLAKTDEMRCTLIGESKFVKRIPDATFGLKTYRRRGKRPSSWSIELRRDRLEKLLFHPKCGLIADPQWGEVDLVFPWAVYEAKGWAGDCRVARRQACSAAAVYLDILDNLARIPGPVGIPRPYQTPSSHNFQIFALTSFGAHWHVLVGYRRGRQEAEYAGSDGMSDTFYIFQKIWSGRITNARSAWELIHLVDQIHKYAATTFRDFVIQHLKPWHKFCEQNYLLDWKSSYDVGRKRKRSPEEDEDLPMPRWADSVNDMGKKAKLQARAKASLAEALDEEVCRERMLRVIQHVFPCGQEVKDVVASQP